MDRSLVKASQVITCSHCGKEMYVTHSVSMNGITGIATKEEIEKIKADLIESITSGELRSIMKPEDRGDALEWLKDPSNILMAEEVEQFIKDIK